MKALIIGAAGFVGKYLAEHLQGGCGWAVTATKLVGETLNIADAEIRDLDILDGEATVGLLRAVDADYIFHLAAQSSVSLSWKIPALTADVNIKGAINVMEALRQTEAARPSDGARHARLLLVGSSEEYGHTFPGEQPVGEGNPARPGNIYAVTKLCQGMLGKIYADAYGLDVMTTRSFNHIGPGQSPTFVVSDFCKQTAEIEAGLREPVLRVGNLSAKRDFTDVRDIVRAYALLATRGERGETYNVGSGRAVAISEILDRILASSSAAIKVETDPAKLRPVDVPVVEADVNKLNARTGWRPELDLDATIRATLDYWRKETVKT